MKDAKKKYLIFLDLDGTVFKSGSIKVDVKLLNEIDRLKKEGHKFIINTGRAPGFTLIIDGIEHFDFISCMLGNIIFSSNGKVVKKFDAMKEKDILKLYKYFEKKDIVWTYKDDYFDKTIFSSERLGRHKAKFVSTNEFLEDCKNNNIFQIMAINKVSDEVINAFPEFDFFNMPEDFCDITIKGSSKAKAVNYFKEIYKDFVTVSIGDSENDVAMFNSTDISISMGNATNEIKSKTDFVTKDCLDDGLIYAFNNILKI